MASSSSSDDNKSYVYDVFLSFCGEDTRKNFVDHLYVALDQQCICTFKDDEKLQKGRDIRDDLLQSIGESRFYIIVFSKSYASSSWCLNELLKIMECHNTKEHTAFPVFYDVYPSEVRKQSGLVGEALDKLNKNESDVEKWREALTKASNLSGWDVRNTADGHEAKVVKLIVEKVSSELRPLDLNVDESLVGMEKRMKDLESYLEIGSNDVRIIGIKGMGGAGKTTLARAIFDKISFNFEDASFVENVRETTSQSGLKKVQKQVLRDVLKDNITVKSVHEGKNLIKKKLRGKKVLIVLDDVDSEEQLEELAGDPNWFKPGSRVIITTRDEQVFNTYTVKWIIDVTLLSDEEAIRLFSRHAFRRNNPSQEYETQSHEVVRYAAGLPLTIKVLGSSLRDKSKPEWIDIISRLKTIPLKETLKKLELSYESLEDDCKEIFLDVACFLRRFFKDDAIIVLKSCGFHAINGLRVIEQKSLIKIVKTSQGYEKIKMHDHIVEMGENIVRREHPDEPSKHSRLWVEEEIEHVLANDLGTEATRCIYLDISTDGIVLESLKKMKKLRCLIIYYDLELSDYHVKIDEASQCFPNSLQYMSLNEYPHRCLPKTFEANNLVTLDMTSSNIEQLWNEGRVMKKLKFLFLGFSKLKSLDLGLMPNLERLDLESCYDLVKLDVYGGCLKSLVYLNLPRCRRKLKSLDLGLMPNLEWLNLEDCSYLVKLDVHGGCLKSLVYLNLSRCHKLKSLEHGMMPNLERLNLEFCFDLEKLDVHGGCLKSLVDLNLSYCRKLKSLDLGMMPNLERLNLKWCSDLVKLDVHCGCLKGLVNLNLSNCHELKSLDLWLMPNLERLNLEFCSDLVKLDVHGGCLKSLVYLNLKGCINLKSTLFIEHLESLEVLYLDGRNLKEIPNYITTGKSNNSLLELHISSGYQMEEVPSSIGYLHNLVSLSINNYLGLKMGLKMGLKIPWGSICGLQHLRTLEIQDIHIEELPDDIGQLKCLEKLDLSHASFKHLPGSICKLKHLKTLILQSCELLEKLSDDVGQLKSLEELNLKNCYKLRDIPSSICKLKHLKDLNLNGCRRLDKLPDDMGNLQCLQLLGIMETGITHLPPNIFLLKGLKIN
ncbi:hypothetical protein R6Q59_002278 [Mikania micrantha]